MPRKQTQSSEYDKQPDPPDEMPLEFGMIIEPEFEAPLSAAELGDLNPNVVMPGGGYAPNPKRETQPLPVVLPEGLSTDTIEVLRTYSGRRTNEQWIAPGVYAVNDPRLYELAYYLLENGHARVVNG